MQPLWCKEAINLNSFHFDLFGILFTVSHLKSILFRAKYSDIIIALDEYKYTTNYIIIESIINL